LLLLRGEDIIILDPVAVAFSGGVSSMKLSHVLGYVLLGLAAIAPVGLRLATWQKPRHHTVDVTEADTGKMLFNHEWVPNDPLCPGGDGLGPVYNANSCVACHNQGGPGGGGDLQHNVTTFTVQPRRQGEQARSGVVHARAVKYQETLAQVDPGLPPNPRPALADLIPPPNGQRKITFPPGVHISQRNTPALFGAKLIDELSDQTIVAVERSQQVQSGLAPSKNDDVPVGRAMRLPGGRIGRFGWKAQTASLAEFVQAACANELGLGNPGAAQPKPLAAKADYRDPGIDLSTEQCNQLTAFIVSLPRPVERTPENPGERARSVAGKQLFQSVGCANCHVPTIGSVDGIYSDLLLHRMGVDLEGGGSYSDPPIPLPDVPPDSGPEPGEWRTPPLWGVADSAPYLHDGRAPTLEAAIRMHGGQGAVSARRFAKLTPREQQQLVAFLGTLRAP
jgi:CxxC motif-containing protein (DUF1111 family)